MEFASGVLGSEPPVNGSPIAFRSDTQALTALSRLSSVASAQAVGQHAELDLRHATVLECGGTARRCAVGRRESSYSEAIRCVFIVDLGITGTSG